MNVGIIGASGYIGEVLVRLLVRHPRVRLAAVSSRQHAGKLVSEVLPRVGPWSGELRFVESDAANLAGLEEVEVWFLALPHGVAAEYTTILLDAGRVVIDLSADFRLNSAERYKEFYDKAHPAPALLREAAYVIPELVPEEAWREARLLACPGCYPTSVQLALAPLLQRRLVRSEGIVITSMSGVSGAGKQAQEFYSFCERVESLAAYGQPKHRHLSEIEEQLELYAGVPVTVQFSPHLVPMHRGILSSMVAQAAPGASAEAVRAAWEEQYAGSPFVRVLPEGRFPDTAHVAGTNRAELGVTLDPRTGNFILTSVIDNLLKGASGQAVQILNHRYGFPADAGL